MGKLAVYKYVSFLMLCLSCVAAVMTLFGLYGGTVSPIGNTAMAMLVYVLPWLMALNAALLVYWLIRRRWHWLMIPLITLLCCIPYSGTLFQWHSLPDDADAQAGIKIATYNVAVFGRETSGFKAEDILAEMKKQKVDILCFQEYYDYSGDKRNSDRYKDYFPFMATGKDDMVIFSRYPIRGHQTMAFDQTNNSAMWADVDVHGRVIRVFNAHLETTGLNRTLAKVSKLKKAGLDLGDNKAIDAIYGNYVLGIMARTGQANIVANEIRQAGRPVIVCGDFNDVPYSYVYNTILGDLVDGFKECGSGLMYTFRSRSVRIDYIFHSKSLKGITYYKLDQNYSDHYPVFMKIALE